MQYIMGELDEEEREEYFRRKKVQVKKRMEKSHKAEQVHARPVMAPRRTVGTMAANPTDAQRLQGTQQPASVTVPAAALPS